MTQSVMSSQICSNQIFRTQFINFCTKESTLTSRIISVRITHSQANNIHYSMYTTKTKNLLVNLRYSFQNQPSFALFGLIDNIQMLTSNISIIIPQLLAQGALICFTCDLNATSIDFAFVATGKNVSGLVVDPKSILNVTKSLVQFRLNGVNAGGLVLNASFISIYIDSCNISGYFWKCDVFGSLVVSVFEQVLLNLNQVNICVNAQKFGKGTLSYVGEVIETCVLCGEGTYSFGLCVKSLQFGEIKSDKFVCKQSFIFDGEVCACREGEVINDSQCVNILNIVNLMIIKQQDGNTIIAELANSTEIVENIIENIEVEQNKMNLDIQNMCAQNNLTQTKIDLTTTVLQLYISSNCSKADINLLANTTNLDQRILKNITILNNIIQIIFPQLRRIISPQ
ncbi:Hypothetical_protein [Hexamita inflata]|uniref:Hypothetical_protein n=1 Tax=Hexamita inflata TaxID=28002 RepID=A0ABP1K1W6_9EUKA